jgi:6,7-dimethyl-8-ribityllumazine synthase
MQEYKLEVPAQVPRIGIVAGRFNHFISEALLEGALGALARNGVDKKNLTVAWVPGAYELPLAADQLLSTDACAAVIALGAVIRGGTPHFDYVAGECARGLMDVSLRRGRPVVFGVLTTDTVEQALERAGPGEGNKGHDAAMACLNMLHLQQALECGGHPGG